MLGQIRLFLSLFVGFGLLCYLEGFRAIIGAMVGLSLMIRIEFALEFDHDGVRGGLTRPPNGSAFESIRAASYRLTSTGCRPLPPERPRAAA